MSNLSAALAAAMQNDDAVAALISGVISGRNFDLQDEKLATSPYACIAVIDLPSYEQSFLGGNGGIPSGQIEVRCISKSSENDAKNLAEAVKTYIRANTTLSWNGSTLDFSVTNWRQTPYISEDLSVWEEILTLDYLG